MKKISYSDSEVTRLDLSSQEVLFSNEKPEDIIGFSLLTRDVSEAGQPFIGVEYFRVPLGPNTWSDPLKMAEKVEETIQSLQLNKNTCQNNTADTDFSRELGILPNSTNSNHTILAANGRGRRRPFEVNKPTLFIYTTNFCAAFSEPFITPAIGMSEELDPNCANPRTWHNDQVLGWYSNYRHGTTGTAPSTWYYDLHTPIVDPSGYLFSHSFDPGTGNGGGDEFP